MAETKFTPGPWSVGYLGSSIVCVNAKIGGEAKLFDIRGWGYLTGKGHGALGLPDEDAVSIQAANANLVSAAPELYEALYRLFTDCEIAGLQEQAGFDCWISMSNAALAKDRGEVT